MREVSAGGTKRSDDCESGALLWTRFDRPIINNLLLVASLLAVPLAMEKVGYREYERIENVIVTIGGHSGESYSVVVGDVGDEAVVQKIKADNSGMEGEAETVAIGELDYDPNSYLTKFEVGGQERVIQMHGEDAEGLMKIQLSGAMMDVVVR